MNLIKLVCLMAVLHFIYYAKAQEPKSATLGNKTATNPEIKYYNENDSLISRTYFYKRVESDKSLIAKSIFNEEGSLVALGLEKLNLIKDTVIIKRLLNNTAPFFSERSINNKTISLNNFSGKVIVLYFWDLDNNNCKLDRRPLNKLVKKFIADSNVVFLAPTFESNPRVMAMKRKGKFAFEMLPNAFNILKVYRVRYFPTLVVINKKGKVVFYRGGVNLDAKKLRKTIRDLLKEK